MTGWETMLQKIQAMLPSHVAQMPAAVQGLIVVVGAAVIWLIIRKVFSIAARRTASIDFFAKNAHVFRFMKRAALYLLVLFSGLLLIRIFELPYLEKIFQAILILLLASPLVGLATVALSYLERRLADRTDTKVDDIIIDLLNKFAGVILYAVAVVVALDMLGLNVMPFIAGAGVAGIAIGFAAKDTLSNLIAGVLLIIDRPFEIGDRIEVWSAPKGSATWGDVIDIGLRATKIRTTDNIIIIIPNNEVMKRDIVNYTLTDNAIRVRINIGVAYEADIEKAKSIILEVAQATSWISTSPAPKVVVRNFGESSVDLQLRVWIENARKRMDTISHVTDSIKEAFDRAGVEIPYPKRDIHIIGSETPTE